MDKILERNAPPLCSQWLSLGGGTTDDSYFLFGFSISQALYNKDVSFFKSKDFNGTYFYLSPSWEVLGNGGRVGAQFGEGSQSHRPSSKIEMGRPRAFQHIKLTVPQCLFRWAQAAS